MLSSGVGWVERSETQHIAELSAFSPQRSAARCGCLGLRLPLPEVLGSRQSVLLGMASAMNVFVMV